MNKIFSILTLIGAAILFMANPNDPENGNTNAPGETNCGTSCHTLNGGMQDGMVDVTGMPALIEPNTAYVLTVTSTNPNGVANAAGFQLTILNSLNQRAGLISSPQIGTSIQPVNPTLPTQRQYWEHNTPASYPVSNMVTWTATWTSPGMPANTTVTWYVANNVANSNGNDTGDLIIWNSGSGMLNGAGSTLAVSITNSTNLQCNGQNTGSATALATGGVPPYIYSWSNGGSGATINNLLAGTYTVTVTDNASATSTASVIITQPTLLVLTAPTITNVSCNGGNNGSITAHASGGVSPYAFDWSNGPSSATNPNLPAGSYTVTVTDDNNCTKTSTYQVTQPALIVINLVSLTHESCAGEEDGAITISTTGGVNPIFAEWSNGSIGTTISNLVPDIYSVTVTDNNNCTKTASYTINVGSTVNLALNQIQHVTCPGGSNGSISVVASGGFAPYTYNWANGATGASISGLTAGSYILTATDSHGCTKVNGYTVNQPLPFNIQIMQVTQNLCFGDNTADLLASASGATSPYTSLWSNGVVGLNNSNVPAGNYSITITDDNGCTSSMSTIVTQPTQVTATVSTTDETGVGANNGSATATAGGGSPAYSYLWSNGTTTSNIVGLAPGTYCVTITDMNGCSASGCGQVDVFGCALNIVLAQDFIICENETGLIMPSLAGESGIVSYLWSDGSTADSLLVSNGGEYCVTVTDEAGCQDMDCIVITEIIIPALACPVINESSPGAQDGAIQCDGIVGIVAYQWSTGATTPSITGLSPGVYCVTVTDVNGCTKEECFNVQPGNCQLSITSAQNNVGCAGDSTGAIVISANNVTAPVTYTWSNGETTSVINNLAAGNYDLTVADATGCFVTSSFLITEPPALLINVDSTLDIHGQETGYIYITVTGGVPPYIYAWSDPLGTIIGGEDLLSLTVPGCYILLVMDANTCVALRDSICIDQDVAVKPSPKFQSLKIYPVPTEDVLIIDLENPISEVLITGVDGRLYKRIFNPGSNKLDVGELESGWYFLQITDGSSWYIGKFVK